MKKNKIHLTQIKNNLYDETLIESNGLQIAIVLRRKYLLFTDSNRVWKYDLQNHCFYEIDLFEIITELFNGKIISNSFKKAVMNYLPYLDLQQVQDYSKPMYFEGEGLENNPKMQWKFDELLKNEQYIYERIKYYVRSQKKLKKEYEVINFDELSDEK